MSRRTARRQRFYHWQRMNRGRPPLWFALMHTEGDLYEALRGVLDDADRMVQEVAGVPLIRGEVGHIDDRISFVGPSIAGMLAPALQNR